MSDDRALLFDIAEASERILKYLGNCTQAEFFSDDFLQAAVLHRLTILGEAVRQLSPETKAKFPEIDWSGYVGLRNILIHQYRKVILEEVWKIIDEEVSVLNRDFRKYLSDEDEPESERI